MTGEIQCYMYVYNDILISWLAIIWIDTEANLIRKSSAFIFWGCFLTLCGAEVQANGAAWQSLANQYFDTCYLPTRPTEATMLGIHSYDHLIEDYSKAGIQKTIACLRDFEKKISNITDSDLNQGDQADHSLILNNIRSQLLTLEVIRPWENNPDIYSAGIANSAFVIMERRYAADEERLAALIQRLKYMPDALHAARHQLHNPPKIYTEIALEQLPGIIQFFKSSVPEAFVNVKNAALIEQFKISNQKVIQALIAYQSWMQNDLLSRSHGHFSIGEVAFRKKLSYDEMVDLPLDQLLAINLADMKKNQREFAKVAKEISPQSTIDEILKEHASHHPEPDRLLQSFSERFNSLTQFIHDKRIITLPSEVRPVMEVTPAFMEATTSASMDTPGPFEKSIDKAYFNVTLPRPEWSTFDKNDYMAGFTYASIITTAIHEAYPGHYVQYLWTQQEHDKVRQILVSNSNAEGWAHYCEQMMLDEGYGQVSSDAKSLQDAKWLKLAQLQDALLRNARFMVGIQLHTGKMSFDQAVQFFIHEGYQSKQIAIMEAKRGTSDPTYLYYTLGKLQILKLRTDMQKKLGSKFSLQTFHDDFMRQGFPPIKIVRKAMLGDDSPTL